MAAKPTGSGGGGDLRDALDALREPLSELKEPLRQLADVAQRLDGETPGPDNWADKLAHHIRRYAPLYAIGTIWALMLVLFPTVNGGDGAEQVGNITGRGSGGSSSFGGGTSGTSSGSGGGGMGGPAAAGGGGGASVSGGGGGASEDGGAAQEGGGGPQVGAAAAGNGPYPWAQGGTTSGGFECTDGARQLPWSQYAVPCREAFTGDNGGETYPGVTADTITFVIRATADAGGESARVVDGFNEAAGQATTAEAVNLFTQWAEYFNDVFDLYGREVVFEDYSSTSSNRVEEAQSRGRAEACADATAIREQGGFAVIAYDDDIGESQPFSGCAAENGLFIPIGAFYYPEKWYAESWHPFVWNTVMECERIARDVAEYVGKRLWNRNAKWAGDHHASAPPVPPYTERQRTLGTYVPDNDGYQRCVDISEKKLKDDYGAKVESRYNYALNVAEFPQHASQAVIQFKSDQVTTLTHACDTISSRLLTINAKQNDWWPEHYLIGVAGQDTPGPARTFDQEQVNGHMFGMSQVGDPVALSSEQGEAAEAWRQMSDQWPPPDGFEDMYFFALHTFNLLQAAGPILTPENVAKGAFALPKAGGATGAIGTWYFGSDPVWGVDHTAIDDSREIFWNANEVAFDGEEGTFVATYNGERFETGEWPEEEPPVYPNGHP